VTVEGVPGATTAMLLDHINYFLIAKAKERFAISPSSSSISCPSIFPSSAFLLFKTH